MKNKTKEEEREEIKDELETIIDKLDDLETLYKEMLEESYGTIKIGYSEFTAGEILKEMDPIAYNVGYNDFTSQEMDDIQYTLENLNKNIIEKDEELKRLRDEIEEKLNNL